MDDGIHLKKSAGDDVQDIDLWPSAGHADEGMASLGVLGPDATVQAGVGLTHPMSALSAVSAPGHQAEATSPHGHVRRHHGNVG